VQACSYFITLRSVAPSLQQFTHFGSTPRPRFGVQLDRDVEGFCLAHPTCYLGSKQLPRFQEIFVLFGLHRIARRIRCRPNPAFLFCHWTSQEMGSNPRASDRALMPAAAVFAVISFGQKVAHGSVRAIGRRALCSARLMAFLNRVEAGPFIYVLWNCDRPSIVVAKTRINSDKLTPTREIKLKRGSRRSQTSCDRARLASGSCVSFPESSSLPKPRDSAARTGHDAQVR